VSVFEAAICRTFFSSSRARPTANRAPRQYHRGRTPSGGPWGEQNRFRHEPLWVGRSPTYFSTPAPLRPVLVGGGPVFDRGQGPPLRGHHENQWTSTQGSSVLRQLQPLILNHHATLRCRSSTRGLRRSSRHEAADLPPVSRRWVRPASCTFLGLSRPSGGASILHRIFAGDAAGHWATSMAGIAAPHGRSVSRASRNGHYDGGSPAGARRTPRSRRTTWLRGDLSFDPERRRGSTTISRVSASRISVEDKVRAAAAASERQMCKRCATRSCIVQGWPWHPFNRRVVKGSNFNRPGEETDVPPRLLQVGCVVPATPNEPYARTAGPRRLVSNGPIASRDNPLKDPIKR